MHCTALVDVLDIKWETLIQDGSGGLVAAQRLKSAETRSALSRFKAHEVLRSIGVSYAFAGQSLIARLKEACQQELMLASMTEAEEGEGQLGVKEEEQTRDEKDELTTIGKN